MRHTSAAKCVATSAPKYNNAFIIKAILLSMCPPCCCSWSAGCPRHHLPTPAQVAVWKAGPAAGTNPWCAKLQITRSVYARHTLLSKTDICVFVTYALSDLHTDLCYIKCVSMSRKTSSFSRVGLHTSHTYGKMRCAVIISRTNKRQPACPHQHD